MEENYKNYENRKKYQYTWRKITRTTQITLNILHKQQHITRKEHTDEDNPRPIAN